MHKIVLNCKFPPTVTFLYKRLSFDYTGLITLVRISLFLVFDKNASCAEAHCAGALHNTQTMTRDHAISTHSTWTMRLRKCKRYHVASAY